ncbi:MAG TPA: hypothetical protein DEQ74_00755 [Wolbachia sp.]|nr:hypothetical protein [Wolbachia sp.]
MYYERVWLTCILFGSILSMLQVVSCMVILKLSHTWLTYFRYKTDTRVNVFHILIQGLIFALALTVYIVYTFIMTQFGIQEQEIMDISLNYVRPCLSTLLSVLLLYYEKHATRLQTREDKVKMANCFAVLALLAFLTIDFWHSGWEDITLILPIFLVVHIMSTYAAVIAISLLGLLAPFKIEIALFMWNMDFFDPFMSFFLVLSLLSVVYTMCIRGKIRGGRLKNVAITSMLTLLFILSTMINIQIPMIR